MDTVYTDSDYEKGYEVTSQMLLEHPDINVVVGGNEYSAVGAARAVRDLGLGSQIQMIGFDSSILSLIHIFLVQYYVITDFVSGSPREVLREAFRAGMITGDEWMEMLKVRNQLAHDYDGVIVKEHCEIIVTTYIDKFYEFGEKVEALLQKEQDVYKRQSGGCSVRFSGRNCRSRYGREHGQRRVPSL